MNTIFFTFFLISTITRMEANFGKPKFLYIYIKGFPDFIKLTNNTSLQNNILKLPQEG